MTLATRLPREEDTTMVQLSPQALGEQWDCPSDMQGQEKQGGSWDR